MNRLPEWVMTNKFPSVYDTESGTAIEMVAKVYGAMQGVVDEHNKIAEETEKQMDAFEKEITSDVEKFENNMTHLMGAHIKSVDDTINILHETQKEEIENAVENFISENPENMEPIINQWLDDHPEATTSVQDHSLTVDKMVIGTMGYVTPQMFGAVGDGVTDDTQAFKDAVAAGSRIYVPKGNYIISDNLTLTEKQILEGTNDTQLTFQGAYGLILNGRHITVRELILYNKIPEGVGITLAGDDTSHYISIDSVQVVNFSKGFRNTSLMWNNIFENVRCTSCDVAFELNLIGNVANFGLTFINCYSNSCRRALTSNSSLATFISCNFGIRNAETFSIENSNLQFLNCNFECDSQVTSGTIAIISGRVLSFKGCKFLVNCGEATTFLSLYTGVKTVSFENCEYSQTDSNLMANSNFFNKGQMNADVCGVRFIGGCDSMPRPSTYSAQDMNWIDAEKSRPVTFYETIAKDRLNNGMLLYNTKSNKLCYYNGTNVVNASDDSVVC